MLDHLEDNIRRVIADIRPQILEKVIENWTSRLDYIRASRGSRMAEIIFKMPILTVSGLSLALNGPVFDRRDVNFEFGHMEAIHNKLFLSSPTK
ncbi:hypothetical protein TNCV_1937681 [Trichonephila clavipes]|nr:hypothetical protein TNCV_1937681 [Trichonephila clavipes]